MPADAGSDWSPWPELKSTTPLADSDNDGMPDNWEISNGLDPENAEDRNNRNDEGYTMLEVYLNSLVADITEAQYQGAEEVGKPGEPYVPGGLSTDVTVSWSMSSGKEGEEATVSKNGIVAQSEYATASEINRYSTRTTFGKTFTTFRPTVEYKNPTSTGAIYFDFDLAEGGNIPSHRNIHLGRAVRHQWRLSRTGLGRQQRRRECAGHRYPCSVRQGRRIAGYHESRPQRTHLAHLNRGLPSGRICVPSEPHQGAGPWPMSQ